MKEALGGIERHKHSAILKAIRGSNDPDNVKCFMPNLDVAAQSCREKLRSTLAQDDIVGVLPKVVATSLHPGSTSDARVSRGEAKTGDDRVIGTRHNAE